MIFLNCLFEFQLILRLDPGGLEDLLGLLFEIVGTEGVEPSRLAAHDPKSCLSANSSTSPVWNAAKL